METTERTAPETAARHRRVGTFTLGVTLVAAGVLMAVSLFWPRLELSWAVKASPVILILLGAETLLAARSGGGIKYDWVGMVLCFLLTGAALCMYAAAWFVTNYPGHGWPGAYAGGDIRMECGTYEGSRSGDEGSFLLDYTDFDGTVAQVLELEAGEKIVWEVVSRRGSVDVDIIDAVERDLLYTGGNVPDGTHSVEAPRDGQYEVWLTGYHAAGSASFVREPGA